MNNISIPKSKVITNNMSLTILPPIPSGQNYTHSTNEYNETVLTFHTTIAPEESVFMCNGLNYTCSTNVYGETVITFHRTAYQ